MMTDPHPDARTRILDAAEGAFAVGGLAGARVAAIAEGASVNKATLYYYFESKDALYNAVLERVFDLLIHLAERVEADRSGDPAHVLMDFVEGYGGVLAEHPHVVRILLRGLLDSGDATLAFMLPRVARVLPLLASQVARGQAHGQINPDLFAPLVPPALVAPLVFISVAGPLVASVSGTDPAALREAWIRNVRELSLHGLVARPSEEP